MPPRGKYGPPGVPQMARSSELALLTVDTGGLVFIPDGSEAPGGGMWDWARPILETYGLAGVVIAAQSFVIWRLGNVIMVQSDARRIDALTWLKQVQDTTAAVDAIVEKAEVSNRVMAALAQALRTTSEAVNVLSVRLGHEPPLKIDHRHFDGQ